MLLKIIPKYPYRLPASNPNFHRLQRLHPGCDPVLIEIRCTALFGTLTPEMLTIYRIGASPAKRQEPVLYTRGHSLEVLFYYVDVYHSYKYWVTRSNHYLPAGQCANKRRGVIFREIADYTSQSHYHHRPGPETRPL
jgi:hypothetical protein